MDRGWIVAVRNSRGERSYLGRRPNDPARTVLVPWAEGALRYATEGEARRGGASFRELLGFVEFEVERA